MRSELAHAAASRAAGEGDLLSFATTLATHLGKLKTTSIAPAALVNLAKKDTDLKMLDSAAKVSLVLNHMHRLRMIDQPSTVGDRGKYVDVDIPRDFLQRAQQSKENRFVLLITLLAQPVPRQRAVKHASPGEAGSNESLSGHVGCDGPASASTEKGSTRRH